MSGGLERMNWGPESCTVPHLGNYTLSPVYRHDNQSYRRIKWYWRKYKDEQLEWSKD